MSDDDKKLEGTCATLEEHLAEAIDGALDDELAHHVEGCDDCRDRIHDATWVVDEIRALGDGHAAPEGLEDRILAAIDARKRTTTEIGLPAPEALQRAAASARDPEVRGPLRLLRSPRHVGAALALAAATLIGVAVFKKHPQPGSSELASAPWHGTVTDVAGASDGLVIVDAKGTRVLAKGDVVPAGARVRTDVRTRARIVLDDGTRVVLDRGAEVAFDAKETRAARLATGSAVFDVTSSETLSATIATTAGTVSTLGGKLSLSSFAGASPSTSVAVARGKATLTDTAGATTALAIGDGATLGKGSAARIEAAGLSSTFAWSESAFEPPADEKDQAASVPGLGELRAKVPGTQGDGDKRLRLVRQAVSVRIAGELARTEIDETFQSDDPQVLEGTFRFPLPPDAMIERLALEVDGKLEEGAFVDRDKGAAIWRGVLFKATPQHPRPQPQEEWIWVPGPWRDPALLEWRAGGRMELRIFPIPAKGARRVVLAYTQHVQKSAGERRYVYPLPHFGSKNATTASIEDFTLDLQLVGHDDTRAVRVQGYELSGGDANAPAEAVVRRALSKKGFVPDGDLVVEYARKDEGALASTYAYQPKSGDAFVALSLSPALPRLPDATSRTQVLVVDASRSMVGERFARASALAAKVVEEMDPRDRFALLACDVSCVPLAVTPELPGKQAAERVRSFLSGIVPEGGSDLVAAMRTAAQLGKSDASRALRVTYFGDGAPTFGARSSAAIEAGVKAAIGEGSVTSVAVGVDADTASLEALARGGGGVVVPYVAGQGLASAALDVIEASSGAALRDVTLTLPQGLTAIAPSRLDAIRAGSEVTVVARMSGSDLAGDAKLAGTIGGKPWSTTIPLKVHATSEAGNAFVPRLWAAARVADLEREGRPADKETIVALSKEYSVPSRHTSLIVLESPAMASAFGVAPKSEVAPAWTGDVVAAAQVTGHHAEGRATLGDLDELATDKLGGGVGKGYSDVGGGGGGLSGPMPTATAAPTVATKSAPPPAAEKNKLDKEIPLGGGWVRMRREWYRTASFTLGAMEGDLESKIAAARAAVVASPDSRDKLADLFGLVARRPLLDEAQQVMATWTARDPLDRIATLRRSELAAREGDRARALRVLTGALDAAPDDVALADGIGDVAMRSGDAKLACAAWSVHAELRPNDVDAAARRISCLRAEGDAILASAALDAIDVAKRPLVETRAATVSLAPKAPAFGDLVVDATWSAPADGSTSDVDVAIVDPKGVRLSWLSPTGVRVSDALAATHETVAVPWAGAGGWTIEVTRPKASTTPIAGTINVRVLGETRSWPFVATATTTTVGRVQIGWASRLVRWD